ncbi:MAG: hypothetical protein DRN66_02070 [Candidatus Nanohalarchaeota archaeon]|nr:MAG: hypothetical protein DRN66_02070 [Candidatus Nanohaloarchaeota archaeon]
MGEVKVDYDRQNDDLCLIKEKAYVGSSVMFRDMILDISRDGKLVGIEMLDASNIIGVSKKDLEKTTQSDMQVFYKPNMVVVRVHLFIQNSEREISIPIATETTLKAAVS